MSKGHARRLTHGVQFAFVMAALLPTVLCTLPSASATPLDQIVAVVDGDVILASEVARQTQRVLGQMRQQSARPPPPGVLQRQVLERLILQRIQLQVAEQNGIEVNDTVLNEAIERIAAQNELTVSEFRQIISEDGTDFGQFREELRNEITISRLKRREVDSRVVVSDREIEYQLTNLHQQPSDMQPEYRLQHILLAVPEGTGDDGFAEAQQRAIEISERLAAGEAFADIAIAESDGQNAFDGGDLGWRKVEALPTLFADRVVSMKEGAVSEPIRSGSGLHIVRLAEKRAGAKHLVTQTRARHILVRLDEIMDETQAMEKLEELRFRIEQGEDFANLARVHSDDKASALEGGDLGWQAPGALVPEFEDVMNRLQPDEVSEPFKTQFGFHIVQVLDRRERDDTEDLLRAEARKQIRDRKLREESESWVRRLRDEAYVEYRLE